MTSTRLLLAGLLVPVVLVIGTARPSALLALVLLALFATAVARAGLWLLDDRDAAAADAAAARAGVIAFVGSVAVAALLLSLGPASVPVLAVLAVVTAARIATRLRPARPAV